MKKIFLLLGFLFILGGYQSLQAQNKNLRIGMRLMPEVFTVQKEYYDFEYKFSVSGGAVIEYKLVSFLHLESGLYFLNKGYSFKNDGKEDGERIVYNYNYLSIPALAKAHFHSFYAAAGPALNILLNHTTSDGRPGISKDRIKKIGIDLNMMLGYEGQLNNNLAWFVEGRVNPGLTTFLEDLSPKMINYGIGLGVLYSIK